MFQNYVHPPVLAVSRLETNMALKKFVHQIPICSIIVNVLTVTES